MAALPLGSYSYKTLAVSKFQYTVVDDDEDEDIFYFFQITPVNGNIAAIQFFSSYTFALHIPPPAGFAVIDASLGPVPVFANSYFITWFSDYVMQHNGNEIWKLTNQKQHAIEKLNDSEII